MAKISVKEFLTFEGDNMGYPLTLNSKLSFEFIGSLVRDYKAEKDAAKKVIAHAALMGVCNLVFAQSKNGGGIRINLFALLPDEVRKEVIGIVKAEKANDARTALRLSADSKSLDIEG